MPKITVTHEFDMYEEFSEYKELVNSREYSSVLYEIDQDLRAKLKYSEEEWMSTEGVQEYLEHLRSMIWESGVFRDQ